jgi:hypothetical protein
MYDYPGHVALGFEVCKSIGILLSKFIFESCDAYVLQA